MSAHENPTDTSFVTSKVGTPFRKPTASLGSTAGVARQLNRVACWPGKTEVPSLPFTLPRCGLLRRQTARLSFAKAMGQGRAEEHPLVRSMTSRSKPRRLTRPNEHSRHSASLSGSRSMAAANLLLLNTPRPCSPPQAVPYHALDFTRTVRPRFSAPQTTMDGGNKICC